MQVYESITSAALSGPTHLTIGNFDGVHRGHQHLITTMLAEARSQSASAGLLTFHPHPRLVLRPKQPVASLTSLSERFALYAEAGLDFTVVHPFTPATAQTEPEDFLQLLHGHLGLSKLWVGPDFALGKDRRGDVAFLRDYGAMLGIDVAMIPEFYWEGQVIRSSRIRRVAEMGNVEWAGVWLGRYYAVQGVVVHGAQRGRTIGFPTANLSLAQGRVAPANGVYATWIWIDGQRHPSVTNIGVRPTLNGSHRTLETHVIDFDGDLYGRCVKVAFVARLRDEVKFPGIEALTAQINRDRDRSAQILAADPQIPPQERFEEMPHPAGREVHVRAEHRADLYANAALSMFSLQGGPEIDGPTVQQHFEIDAADREDLLLRWLRQLLWQTKTQGVMFHQFWIERISDTALRALAVGRKGRRHTAHIQGVTCQDLTATSPAACFEGNWRARILFDT